MFKIGAYFGMCLKLAKIGISNINSSVCLLMTYQANLYFLELSLGFVRDMA